MVNYIWVGMTVVGVLYAMVNGTMDEVNKALFVSAKEAVTLCIGLMSILVFWLGLMKIAENSGLLDKLSLLFRPLMKWLFPEIPENHPAIGYILSNMMANTFGLGNAATPLGIKAMEEMKELNNGKVQATRSMITFLALNTSAITIIPTTVIAIRINYNSVSPTDIVFPTILATAISAVGAIIIDRYFYFRRKRNGRE